VARTGAMSGGGWTVADTAVARSTPTPTRTGTGTLSRQSSADGREGRSSLKRSKGGRLSGDHHVRWSDRSQSEEELDKLLDGLEELTVTLPDFGAPKSGPSSLPSSAPKITHSSDFSSPHPHFQSQKRSQGDGEERRPQKADPLKHLAADERLVVPASLRQALEEQSPSAPDRRGDGGRREEFLADIARGRDILTSDILDDYHEEIQPTGKPRDRPYHTLRGSKPFSYIHGPAAMSSNNNRLGNGGENVGNGVGMLRHAGLESPSLLRKIMGGGQPDATLDLSDVDRPSSPPKFSSTPKIAPMSNGTKAQPAFRERSEREIRIEVEAAARSKEPIEPIKKQYEKPFQPQPPRRPSPLASDHLNDVQASLTWLERQQMKLKERRDQERKRSGPRAQLDSELKNTLAMAGLNVGGVARSETTDGYCSDLASMVYSEAPSTRESSPLKITEPKREQPSSTYNVPVRVEVHNGANNARGWNAEENAYSTYSAISNGNLSQQRYEAPQRPMYGTTVRREINEEPMYGSQTRYNTTLSRQNSDLSYDRTRPALHRRRLRYDSGESEGAESYASGLVTTDLFGRRTLRGSNTSLESAGTSMWGGSQTGSRPVTPGFPSAPPTPVFGQRSAYHHHYNRQNSRAASPAGEFAK